MPFGDQLGADDNIGISAGDRLQLQPETLDAAEQVGRHDDGAGVWKMPFHFFRDPFHARTACDEMVECPTFRARLWRWLTIAALMALDLVAKSVLDQPA